MTYAYEMMRRGGSWVGNLRSWVQRKMLNGERVTWGSETPLEPPMTMRQLEEAGSEAAAAAYDDGYRAGIEAAARYVESVCADHRPGMLVTRLGAKHIAAEIRAKGEK